MRRARRSERSGSSQDPMVWASAEGSTVKDVDGKSYIDLCASFGSAALGHRHPEVQSAVAQQLQKLWQAMGDLQPAEVKIQLLERLCELSPWPQSRVMLGLSGSDSVEAALKTAALYTEKPGVLSFHGSYHGLSYGALSVSAFNDDFRAPFSESLNPQVHFAPFPQAHDSAEQLISLVETHWRADIGAILVEPIQSRGGINLGPAHMLPKLKQWCHDHGALLIVDEIYTGLGRCGAWWLSANENQISADLICIGKALGGGLPISACLGAESIMQAWAKSGHEALHTSTFAGYPLACAAALATLQVIETQALPERAQTIGNRFMEALKHALKENSQVKAVRGQGLLVGIELVEPGAALKLYQQLLERGFITLIAGKDARVLQLSPALTIESELLIDRFIPQLKKSMNELYGA
ncbi:MAG: aspartate aminotransferase family protein [Myxococcales bacterium]|nr:MAG: aspartate aminotransferase family protein [Myxococcales bacterium]